MRIGIFGGTFNPVHRAHIGMAEKFLNGFGIDLLYIVPAGTGTHKESDSVVSDGDRLEMAAIAFEGNPSIRVSDYEIRHSGRCYTVRTVDALAQSSDEVYLLMGGDMLAGFEMWYGFHDICRRCTIVYAERDIITRNGITPERKAEEYRKKYSADIRVLSMGKDGISSAAIRKMIKKGIDVSDYITPEVTKYITEKGLYR